MTGNKLLYVSLEIFQTLHSDFLHATKIISNRFFFIILP